VLPGIDFVVGHSLHDSIHDEPEFEDKSFYLWFSVEDTGRVCLWTKRVVSSLASLKAHLVLRKSMAVRTRPPSIWSISQSLRDYR
jgi:hypothetical protein